MIEIFLIEKIKPKTFDDCEFECREGWRIIEVLALLECHKTYPGNKNHDFLVGYRSSGKKLLVKPSMEKFRLAFLTYFEFENRDLFPSIASSAFSACKDSEAFMNFDDFSKSPPQVRGCRVWPWWKRWDM